MARKHLYRTNELFDIIDKYLADNGLKPDDLDYGLATSDKTPIRSYAWDTIGAVNFGGSEGIYLDIYAHGNVTGDRFEDVHLGTYKTLSSSKDAYKMMGNLNAEFVFATRDFVNAHIDDFEWTGWHVEFFRGEDKVLGITCQSEAKAKERAKSGMETYKCDSVKITNNATCTEEILRAG